MMKKNLYISSKKNIRLSKKFSLSVSRIIVKEHNEQKRKKNYRDENIK